MNIRAAGRASVVMLISAAGSSVVDATPSVTDAQHTATGDASSIASATDVSISIAAPPRMQGEDVFPELKPGLAVSTEPPAFGTLNPPGPRLANTSNPACENDVKDSGRRVLAAVGRPTQFQVKLRLGNANGFDAREKVEFYVNGKAVGIAPLDKNGLAVMPFTPAENGRHVVTYRIHDGNMKRASSDINTAVATLIVTDKPVVVIDLDNVLGKPNAMAKLQKSMAVLCEKFEVAYLTSKTESHDASVRRALGRSRKGLPPFPRGPILYNNLHKMVRRDKPHHEQFKVEAIKGLQLSGIAVVAGLSASKTGASAFSTTNLHGVSWKVGRVAMMSLSSATLELVNASEDFAARAKEVSGSNSLTGDAAFQRDMDLATNTKNTSDNAVDVLIDGNNALPAFLDAISRAKNKVLYRTFEYHDDEAGNLIADALIKKAKTGLDVAVHIDAFASKVSRHKDTEVIAKMRAAGIKIVKHNPGPASRLVDNLHRDHRKLISIDDGKEAFIGGMNTGVHYLGTLEHDPEFHDVFLRIRGPAANIISDKIHESIVRDSDGRVQVAGVEKDASIKNAGDLKVRIVHHFPKEDEHIKDAYLLMFKEAKSHINIENSFPPHDDVIDALIEAINRGVEVNFIYGRFLDQNGDLPRSGKYRKMSLTTEKHLARLAVAGANVYLMPRYTHAKTLSVDGKYASVGSSNLDNFALDIDRESIAIVSDKTWVTKYEEDFFHRDMAKSTRLPNEMGAPFWADDEKARNAAASNWPTYLR